MVLKPGLPTPAFPGVSLERGLKELVDGDLRRGRDVENLAAVELDVGEARVGIAPQVGEHAAVLMAVKIKADPVIEVVMLKCFCCDPFSHLQIVRHWEHQSKGGQQQLLAITQRVAIPG